MISLYSFSEKKLITGGIDEYENMVLYGFKDHP